MTVEMKFDNPALISVGSEPDVLVIKISQLKDKQGKVVTEETEIRKELPNMADPEIAEQVASAGAVVATAMASQFSFIFVIRFFMKSSMN